jgi:hypothetical protein
VEEKGMDDPYVGGTANGGIRRRKRVIFLQGLIADN